MIDSTAEQREVWDPNTAYYSPGDNVEAEAIAPPSKNPLVMRRSC